MVFASTGTINRGTALVNGSGTTLTQFTLEYDGEQWRLAQSNGSINALVVVYGVFESRSGSLEAAGYVDIPSARFDGPRVNTDPGSATSLEGNDGANCTQPGDRRDRVVDPVAPRR